MSTYVSLQFEKLVGQLTACLFQEFHFEKLVGQLSACLFQELLQFEKLVGQPSKNYSRESIEI